MSHNLKKTQKNKKILKVDRSKEEYYIFDFKYLTTNNAYNFAYFKKEKNNKLIAYDNLIIKILEISKYSTDTFNILNKKNGLETIPIHRLKFKPNELKVSNDDKFISIRFNYDKNRLICIKSKNHKNVLHIIGFDFNFSAYSHE